jgi:CRP-like cAMP-binding protein
MSQVNLQELADSPLFKGLARKEIEYLGAFFLERKVEEGKTVFIENMPGEALYLIKKGTVRISQMVAEGDEQILIVLGAGDVFGEMAIVDSGTRGSTARIAEEAILYSLSTKIFEKIAAANPRLGMQLLLNIVRIFTARLRAARRDYRTMLTTIRGRKKVDG